MFVNCCVYSRSTCANILVANYFYKQGFSLHTLSHSRSVTYVGTLPPGINTLVLIFNYFSCLIYVCGIFFCSLFTFHRSLIFRLITCSTEQHTTTSLPTILTLNLAGNVFSVICKKIDSIQFTNFYANHSSVSNRHVRHSRRWNHITLPG